MSAGDRSRLPVRTRPSLAGALAARALALLIEGEAGGARAAAAAALVLAGGEDVAAVASARSVLGHALLGLGDPDGAVETADVMLQDPAGDGDELARARALALRAAAEVERQNTLAALDALAEALGLVERAAPTSLAHVAASVAVASVLVRLSLFEPAVALLAPIARQEFATTSSHRLLAVRSLVAVRLLWAARLELLGERRAAGEQYALTASAALWLGRVARHSRRPRLERAAVAAEAFAVERLGEPALAAARATAALAGEPNPRQVPEWLPGRLALAGAAWAAGDIETVRGVTAELDREDPTGSGDMLQAEAVLWDGLVEPALARIAAPGPGAGSPIPEHPAVPHLREIAVAGARLMWQEREARAADLRQRILRRELARHGERTARELLVDVLTGLGNRRRLEQELGAGGPGAVLFVDVDHFKRVNDTFGHGTGDEVLRRVAGLLSGCCRDEDVVVRYGGDEFVVLLAPSPAAPDALAGARRLGERLLRRVRAEDWSVLVGSLPVTVSVGVASGNEAGVALRSSDAAMLAAKRAGRDTLVQL